MFYSTEILCDKRYALSTVWRAGNTAPGARTTGIRRKAVLEVSVEKTCGTIKEPPGAPIALRLQGTLLYGTARIYQEQCRYVLGDTERTQRAMSKLSSGLFDDKLDSNAGKTRSVQIVLPNDPSFDLDLFQLPPLDFDAQPDASFLSQERQASWTNLSLGSRSSQNTQLPQLVLDADSSAGGSFAGGFPYSGSGASHLRESPTPFGRAFDYQEEENLLVDVGLFIDENGNIIEDEPRTEPQLPSFPAAALKTAMPHKAGEQEVVPMIADDDDHIFSPVNRAGLAGNPLDKLAIESGGNKISLVSQTPSSPTTLSSPSTMLSRQAYQRASKNKVNFVDDVTQIPLSDYFSFVSNYAQHMERTATKKANARNLRRSNDAALNRQTAYGYTFGRGIFGVANAVKGKCSGHPLAEMFSGEALGEAFFGKELSQAKRRRAETAEPSTPIARGFRGNLDGFDDEQDIELGRQPASALSDNPSLALNRHSSVLPGSSARGSAQHSTLRVHQHPDGRLSSSGFPDSPSFIQRYSDEEMDLPPQLPSSRGNPFLPSLSSPGRPGSGVATDRDAKTDRIGEEMRRASVFFSLVRQKATEAGHTRPGWKKHRWVKFGHTVAPFKKNRAAVVGAFMSLLALATTHKVHIHQAEAEGDIIDRAIFIGVKPMKHGKGKKKRSYQEMSESHHSDTASRLASEGELTSGRVFPSPIIVDEPFFRGGELSGIALTGAA